jgi:hypothetical protein
VSPETVCLGETITFTIDGVIDNGGIKRVFCTAKTKIPSVAPTYEWRITKPDGTTVPPAGEPPGSGAVATVIANAPGTYSVTFAASAVRECPPGDVTIGPASKQLVLSATLTADPTDISAKSTGSPWNYSVITVAWNPPDCEGTLEIVTPLVGNNNYMPPNDGTLQRINATTWIYTAFDEPQSELCPEDVPVTIAAKQGTTQVASVNVRVRPVHTFWTHAHRHGPAMPLHSPDTADFTNDYDYLRWKYGGVLATTGGFFTTKSISTSFTVNCDGTTAYACTKPKLEPGWDVEFGTSTFLGSENQAASIIGHELVHTSGTWPVATTECTAYTWELNRSQQTGVFQCDATYLGTITQQQNCTCNGCP